MDGLGEPYDTISDVCREVSDLIREIDEYHCEVLEALDAEKGEQECIEV